jgi:hypothetical protein
MRRVDAAAFLGTAVAVVAANAIAAVALGCTVYAVGNLLSRCALFAGLPMRVKAVEPGEAES